MHGDEGAYCDNQEDVVTGQWIIDGGLWDATSPSSHFVRQDQDGALDGLVKRYCRDGEIGAPKAKGGNPHHGSRQSSA